MLPKLEILQEHILNTVNTIIEETQPSYEREKSKIYSMLGDITEALELSGAILAGGTITSLFTNSPINDFDIYFRDKESFSKFIAAIYSQNYKYRSIVNITSRSILMTDHKEGKLQLIVYKFFNDAQDIFNSFDFTVNMGAYDFKDKKFVFHPEFFKHNAQKYLSINTNTDYPLISVLRLDKYRQKGYTVSKPQVLKLLLRVSEINFDSWDVVLDHIGGMYGVDPEKIFDKTKEFSLEEAITQLSSLETIDGTWVPGSFSDKDIGKQLDHLLVEEVKAIALSNSWDKSEKYFKYVFGE